MNYLILPIAVTGKRIRAVVRLSVFLLVLAVPVHSARHDPDSRGGDDSVILPLLETPADTLEPNDTPDEAALLTWGNGGIADQALAGAATITSGLDLDFYTVRLSFGDSLLAVVTVPEGSVAPLDQSISIMDSAGTVLAKDLLTPGEVSVAAPYEGEYLLLVSDRSLLDGSPFTGTPREYELSLRRLLRRGDTDGNGFLDYRDAFVVFMLASGLLDLSLVEPRVLAAADIDGDGVVLGDMADFNLLMQRVSFIPARDEGAGGKRKSSGGATLLALADGSEWTLDDLLASIPVEKADSIMALIKGTMGVTVKHPVASVIALRPAFPNPFNPTTTISFSLQGSTNVILTVHDVRGRLVCTLASGKFPAGNHRVNWNGKDYRGRALASGIYFSRLVGGGTIVSRKLVLLK